MKADYLFIGKRVVSNRAFSGVAAGTPAEIVKRPNSWPETNSVAVQWNRYEGDQLVDWFSFDDLQFLDEA